MTAPTTRTRRIQPGDEWLTVDQVARELGVSKMTVYRRIHAFELKAYLFGRRIFKVERADLERYIRDSVYGAEEWSA